MIKEIRQKNSNWSSHPYSRILSFIHACIIVPLCINILITKDRITLMGPEYTHDFLWALMFDITTIYLVFDMFMMLIRPEKNDFVYHVHHIVGGLGIFLIRQLNRVWLLGLFFELTEISTIFLNITWICVKKKKTNTLIFKAAGLLLVFFFFFVRIIGGLLMFIYVYNFRDQIISWGPFMYIYIYGGSCLMFSLNSYWFYKLILKIYKQIKNKKID